LIKNTEREFLTLNQANQAGVMFHSESNLLGFSLQAYKEFEYTGFSMRYLAVGKCSDNIWFLGTALIDC